MTDLLHPHDLPDTGITPLRLPRAAFLVLATMLLASAWALLQLPADARLAIHWDLAGHANDWAAPWFALLVMPVLAALLLGLQAALPHLDPRGHNLYRSPAAWRTVTALFMLAPVLGHGLILGSALGWAVFKPAFIPGVFGTLFLLLGNIMGKLRWNYTIGIRTPWTLADERVWDQTHRWGGKLIVVQGALMWALALLPWPSAWMLPTLVGLPLASFAAITLKSWLLWRARRRDTDAVR